MVLEFVAYEDVKDDLVYIAGVEYYVRARQLAILFILQKYAEKSGDARLAAYIYDAIQAVLNDMSSLAGYADKIASILESAIPEPRIEVEIGKVTIAAPEQTDDESNGR